MLDLTRLNSVVLKKDENVLLQEYTDLLVDTLLNYYCTLVLFQISDKIPDQNDRQNKRQRTVIH